MKHFNVLCTVLLILSAAAAVAADSAVIQYQARLFQKSAPVGEDVEVKFAIVDDAAGVTLWSNDGSSTGGLEPATAVSTAAANGVVSVDVGDGSISGMAEIPKFIFNRDDDVKLRVWFNDKINGFDQLTPDLPIRIEEFRLVRLSEDLTVYVDPVNGNDANSGLSPAHAKRTIQNAITAIPDRVVNGAVLTIDLADGVYREALSMSGFDCDLNLGSAIVFQGDETAIATKGANPIVRISGLDDDSLPAEKSRQTGIQIFNSSNIIFNGVQFDNYTTYGVALRGASQVEFNGCNFSDNLVGVVVTGGASGFINDSTAENNARDGVWFDGGGTGRFERSQSLNNGQFGIRVALGSTVYLKGSTYNNNQHGVILTELSAGYLTGINSANNNNSNGFRLDRKSVIINYGTMTGSGNGGPLSVVNTDSAIY